MKLNEVKFHDLYDKRLLLVFQQAFAERYPNLNSSVSGKPPSLSIQFRSSHHSLDVTVKFSRYASAGLEAQVRSSNSDLDLDEPYCFSELMSGNIKMYIINGLLTNGDDYAIEPTWEEIAQSFCDEIDRMLKEL